MDDGWSFHVAASTRKRARVSCHELRELSQLLEAIGQHFPGPSPGEHFGTTLAHQDLNQVLDFPPACERLAPHLAGWYFANLEPSIGSRLVSTTASERPTSSAGYIVPERAEDES